MVLLYKERNGNLKFHFDRSGFYLKKRKNVEHWNIGTVKRKYDGK